MIRTGSSNKFKANYKYKDIYNHYKTESVKPIAKEQHSKVLADAFEGILNLVITSAFKLKFPHKFGELEIMKKEQKIVYDPDGGINRISYKVDWKATNSYWKTLYPDLSPTELKKLKDKPKIYCQNKYRMFFKYHKTDAIYKNKSVVMFIPSRTWCRKLANHLQTDPYKTDYKEK
tara:strand:+ start:758 stop:1282 length:525 start_codon:yes stop_codon:yes gene_type:complete